MRPWLLLPLVAFVVGAAAAAPVQVQIEVVDADRDVPDAVGGAIARSGGVVAVGVPGYRRLIGGEEMRVAGAVVLLACTGGTCEQRAVVLPPGLETDAALMNAAFGGAVAMDGALLAVAAPHYAGQTGRVWIYDCTDPAACTLRDTISSSVAQPISFGTAVTVTGTRVVVTTAYSDADGIAARVYDCGSVAGCVLTHLLGASIISPFAALPYIPAALAANGARVVLGRIALPGDRVRTVVYDLDEPATCVPAGALVQQCTEALLIVPPSDEPYAYFSFGSVAALRGELLVLTDQLHAGGNGTVLLYSCARPAVSCELLTAIDGEIELAYFGIGVDIVLRGETRQAVLAVGAASPANPSAVFWYTCSGIDASMTTVCARVDQVAGPTSTFFGATIAIDEATTSFAVVGAPGAENGFSFSRGAVFVVGNASPAPLVFDAPVVSSGAQLAVNDVSPTKDCRTGAGVDALGTGYRVEAVTGESVCCRVRGVLTGGECLYDPCAGETTTSHYAAIIGDWCFPAAKCAAVGAYNAAVEQVAIVTGDIVESFSDGTRRAVGPIAVFVSVSAQRDVYVRPTALSTTTGWTVTLSGGARFACTIRGTFDAGTTTCSVATSCGLGTLSPAVFLFPAPAALPDDACFALCVSARTQ